MDDLREQIAKTNELLAELIRRDDERQREADAKMQEYESRFDALRTPQSQGAADPVQSVMQRVGTPEMQAHMAESRKRVEEIGKREDEYREATLRLLQEQNALLRSLIGRFRP